MRNPWAMSAVTWFPPTGSTAVWLTVPSWKSAKSVVPPPISTTAHAHIPFVVAQHGFGRGDRVEDKPFHFHTAGLDALGEIAQRRRRGGDDVRLHLQPEAVHADRIADALLAVDDEPARQDVHHLPVVRHGDGARGFTRPGHVLGRNQLARRLPPPRGC